VTKAEQSAKFSTKTTVFSNNWFLIGGEHLPMLNNLDPRIAKIGKLIGFYYN